VSVPVVEVRPDGQLPYGTEVLKAATGIQTGVLILGLGRHRGIPTDVVASLLTGSFGIGAVVPQTGGADDPNFRSGRCDVAVVSDELAAVSACSVIGARIDPHESDHRKVIGSVFEAVRSAGMRVVCEPRWVGEAPPDGTAAAGPAEPTPGLSSIAVVTGALAASPTRSEDRATRELITSLVRLTRHAAITVVVTEPGALETDVANWESQGVSVLTGPAVFGSGFEQVWGAYTHVIMTVSGARSSARDWVRSTQAQAMKVFFSSRLALREIAALTPATAPDDLAGLEFVFAASEGRAADLARWADAVWCDDVRDMDFFGGLLPGKPVVHIPSAVSAIARPVPLSKRRGVVVVADEGHDVIRGDEDAAIRAVRDVMPHVHGRDPQVSCTVISDRPTPLLARVVEAMGARLAPSARVADVIGSARVVLAAHAYGLGQPGAIMSALAAGTPVVATPAAVGGLDLGPVAPNSIFGAEADLVSRTWRLLTDDAEWNAAATAAADLLSNQFGEGGRAAAIGSALTPLGITTGPPKRRWPDPEDVAEGDRYLPVKVDLRPSDTPPPPDLTEAEATTERDRYRRWVKRYGPAPATLASILDASRRLPYRPRISILMPVFNADPLVLRDTIDSVRAQIYDNWQLCIADDGSTSPPTTAILDSVRRFAAVTVVDLPETSGISAATNAALSVADGEFVTFLDHDDILKPHALAQVARWLDADPTLDVVYSDEDKLDGQGELYDAHLKPDWSPDLLMTQNYMGHLTVARRSLVEAVGGLRSAYDGSQDYDLVLRLSERTDRIGHIPEPLYSWRAVPGSAAADAEAKPYAIDAARRSLVDALKRRGNGDRVDVTSRIGCFRARYPIPGRPRVAIIIPTRDGIHLLGRCIESVLDLSTYENYEILIVDNQSTDGDTLSYLADGPWRVIRYPEAFNYARMMNYAARFVDCDALLFLNNDTEVITPEWIEGLLEHAMRPEVGAVGGRLYFENGEPQHEGIMIGVGRGYANNLDHKGYWNRGELTRNVSAVTGACTMIRPSVFWRVGGNDERLRVAYNDVDLCLRMRQAGYQIVYTPFVELYHMESASRAAFEHVGDAPFFAARWLPNERCDPYYSPMFSADRLFEIRN